MLNKSKKELCERIAELELQIELAIQLKLDYSYLIKERSILLKQLDSGVENETSTKKNKKKGNRLF